MYIQCCKCFEVHSAMCDYSLCDCGAHIDTACHEIHCTKCEEPLSLTEGNEWPNQEIYCWSCAHKRILELTNGT